MRVKNGIKKFLKSIIQITKEEKYIPIEHRPINGHEFDGKVALVSGGSGGIGYAISKALLKSGCKVIIGGINKVKLGGVLSKLSSENAAGIVIDYNFPLSFSDKVSEAVSIFGKIDIFISSSGIHTDRDGLDFMNISLEEWDSIIGINLRGTFFFCQTVANYMIKSKIKGHILLISSQSALEPSWSPYRLSKLGISGITRGLAQRLIPYGIVVNGIGPGPTATSMQKDYTGGSIYTCLNPIERYTMPDEVAEFAKMMVSDLGNTIIGDTLYMSGGRGITEIR